MCQIFVIFLISCIVLIKNWRIKNSTADMGIYRKLCHCTQLYSTKSNIKLWKEKKKIFVRSKNQKGACHGHRLTLIFSSKAPPNQRLAHACTIQCSIHPPNIFSFFAIQNHMKIILWSRWRVMWFDPIHILRSVLQKQKQQLIIGLLSAKYWKVYLSF